MKAEPFFEIGSGITAIIGGGGKTTLLYVLAEELREKGSVILATSTHIRIPQQYPFISGGPEEVESALREQGIVCAGTPAEDGKITAPDIPFPELRAMADFVLVEADGSKGLPLKAHASHEPVIPPETGKTILVVGADGLGKSVRNACHRPELWAELAGIPVEGCALPKGEAAVIAREGFGDLVYINKAEFPEEREQAFELAEKLNCPVIMGSLHRREYRKCR